ncbi:hypothetical protein AB836_00385 [Rickettsiales bacterium (ex Bugula neritina AB1)]|nr:hypothetical protein AB836_00385 [Rickettsiales bacterium (ex Bugula neritina AB1)]
MIKSFIVANNPKLYYDYLVDKEIEAGVELLGNEVKSIRLYGLSIQNSFCVIKNMECWWQNVFIKNHLFSIDQDRPKRLLLKKSQIFSLYNSIKSCGGTIGVCKAYFNKDGFFKIIISFVKKKKIKDKREELKKKDMERSTRIYEKYQE